MFAGFGRRKSGLRRSAGVDTPSGSSSFRVTGTANKPAGGGLLKGRPSRSKNKPQRGEAQERHGPGHGVTSAVRRRAPSRGKAERRRDPPYGRACTPRRTGSKPSGRPGITGMQFHRAREQPLKGEAQERSRHEIRPARLGREQPVARVTKPWRRTIAGRQSPRTSGLARPKVL